ncbi:MAG TPA: hypothetical protein VEV45_20790 [Streptosporangiaceae bacterium]|nr:hypothetical protein [Streptosporangiaceae bacterium]
MTATALNKLSDEDLARVITHLAVSAYPTDMEAAERFALRLVDGILLGTPPSVAVPDPTGGRPVPGTVGPDYDPETETAWEASVGK